MMANLSETKKVKEWRQQLTGEDCEALVDLYHTDPEELMTSGEVFDTITQWQGGVATAYQIRCILERIYGKERLRAAMLDEPMELQCWKEILMPREYSPMTAAVRYQGVDGYLHHGQPGPLDRVHPDDVFNNYVAWEGGLVGGFSIRRTLQRIYQVEL